MKALKLKGNNELLFHVIERYLFHKDFKSDNKGAVDMAATMCEIELYEMWVLTQEN